MKQVEIAPIQAAITLIADFNRLDLCDIILTENGKPIEIQSEVLEEWRVCGMSNKDFVELRFWEEEATR